MSSVWVEGSGGTYVALTAVTDENEGAPLAVRRWMGEVKGVALGVERKSN